MVVDALMAVTLSLLAGSTGYIVLAKPLTEWVVRGGRPNAVRFFSWGVVVLLYTGTHMLTLEAPAVIRMIVLCAALLAGMKGVVYGEWLRSGGSAMSWERWLAFGVLWFGMVPDPWVSRTRKIEWKSHLGWGMLAVVIGCGLLAALYVLEVRNIVLVFVAMSMAFHFGVLRLLTAFWRLMGVPVRTLFRNPLKLRGCADFWAKRWNLAFSHMMARCVQRPLESQLGKRGAVFAAFVMSGLFHELAITVPVQAGYGLPTLFFLAHGAIVMIENKLPRLGAVAVTFVALILGLPVLFPKVFADEVIYRCYEFYGGVLRKITEMVL